MMRLSIIIPAYNSADTIGGCLEALKQSTYQDYEIIVVYCGDNGIIPSIAARYANKFIQLKEKVNKGELYNTGLKVASGEIIVTLDADINVKPDTLAKISEYFFKYPKVSALTGLLSTGHPNPDFFSQYKNLYMHYIFRKLPERITFLYGSIAALRREAVQSYDCNMKFGEDTALGQRLVSSGKEIAFLKDLEVVHLKKYNLFSFANNDFQIPFYWAKIFLKYKGWGKLCKNKTGYIHSPKEQLLSIALVFIITFLFIASVFE